MLFAVAYSVSSLSCTLPIFLVVVGSALATRGWIDALLQFLSYAAGMGFVIAVLSLSMAVFREALIDYLGRFLPYVHKASGVLLVGAGGYILYYWLVKGQLLG